MRTEGLSTLVGGRAGGHSADRVTKRTPARLTCMKWADIAERTLWAVLQSGVAVTIVVSAHLSPALTVLLTGCLALLKGYATTRLTASQTAATLPASLEPCGPVVAPLTAGS